MLERLYQKKEEHLLENVVVVTQYGPISADIRQNFPGAYAVNNPAPERGISSSIRLGLEQLEQISAGSQSCLFAVADQPFLTAGSLEKMIKVWQQNSYGIVSAAQVPEPLAGSAQAGNPVIFSAKYYEELKNLSGDTGGKKVMRRHMEDVGFCAILPRELEDIDTKEALGHSHPACIQDFPFLKESGHVISLVGAGGKTTLMYALAAYYAETGRTVVVTTTTHICKPEPYPPGYPVVQSLRQLKERLKEYPVVVAGADAPGGKLKMPDTMGISDYVKAADIVLVEADGAKHFPCKAPLETEPVIPDESSIVIGVAGVDTLGKPLSEACFRKEKMMELLHAGPSHRMSEKDLATVLLSENGTRKQVGQRDYYIVLNKCDDQRKRGQGERVKKILQAAGAANVFCLALKPPGRQGFPYDAR